jgi:hypothetical protein
MKQRTLAATARNYPYLQGLYALPAGLVFFLSVPVNLYQGPSEALILGVFGVGLLLCLLACVRIARYYRENYGEVTVTRSRHVRQAVALVAWAAVLYGGTHLVATPDQTAGVLAAAFAVGVLAYCAMLVGLRAHHVAVWGTLLVAGLLPIWGGVGVDWSALPIGVALMASGLLDHRLLVRSFGVSEGLNPASGNAGG